jgi:gas vesicle protein
MKHIHTFKSFLNEGNNLSYWTDYAKDTSGQAEEWKNQEAKTVSEVVALIDNSIKHWNDNADSSSDKVSKSSEKRIGDLVMQYFKQFKSINGNIIDAMIAQES